MDTRVNRESAASGVSWHGLTVEETRRRLDTSIEKGLDAGEAQARLQKFARPQPLAGRKEVRAAEAIPGSAQ
jgi:hypothetical protein